MGMASLPDDVTPATLRAHAADADALLDRLDDTTHALLEQVTPDQAFQLGATVMQLSKATDALKQTAADLAR